MEGTLVNKAGETSCPPGVYILLEDNVNSAVDEYKEMLGKRGQEWSRWGDPGRRRP